MVKQMLCDCAVDSGLLVKHLHVAFLIKPWNIYPKTEIVFVKVPRLSYFTLLGYLICLAILWLGYSDSVETSDKRTGHSSWVRKCQWKYDSPMRMMSMVHSLMFTCVMNKSTPASYWYLSKQLLCLLSHDDLVIKLIRKVHKKENTDNS